MFCNQGCQKASGQACKYNQQTVLPTITSQMEAQEEATRLNVINQLGISTKEGVLKVFTKLDGSNIMDAILQTADGSLAGNVGNMSATCRQRVKMSPILPKMRVGANTKTPPTLNFVSAFSQHSTTYQEATYAQTPILRVLSVLSARRDWSVRALDDVRERSFDHTFCLSKPWRVP